MGKDSHERNPPLNHSLRRMIIETIANEKSRKVRKQKVVNTVSEKQGTTSRIDATILELKDSGVLIETPNGELELTYQ